jgi:hypothetical protein
MENISVPFVPLPQHFTSHDKKIDATKEGEFDNTPRNLRLTWPPQPKTKHGVRMALFACWQAIDRVTHSDTARALALAEVYDAEVVTIGHSAHDSDTTHHFDMDFAQERGFRRLFRSLECPEFAVGILDYFWLQSTYFEKGGGQAIHGYGTRLFSLLATNFFGRMKGKVLFLPNDYAGSVHRMVYLDLPKVKSPVVSVHFPTHKEGFDANPLSVASLQAESSPAYKNVHDYKTRITPVHSRGLHDRYPFVMLYRTQAFPLGPTSVYDYLNSLRR